MPHQTNVAGGVQHGSPPSMADVMGGTSTANQSAAGDSLQNNSQSLRFHSGAGVRGGSGDASALIADGAISKARPSNAAAKSEYHP